MRMLLLPHLVAVHLFESQGARLHALTLYARTPCCRATCVWVRCYQQAKTKAADQTAVWRNDALRCAGVAYDDIYVDHASGAKASRPQSTTSSGCSEMETL